MGCMIDSCGLCRRCGMHKRVGDGQKYLATVMEGVVVHFPPFLVN